MTLTAFRTFQASSEVSYGPQAGAHNGSSLLERAIDDLIDSQKYVDELFVVVPIGNSFQSRAHAQLELTQGGGEIAWHVPPDSETPGFLEIWIPLRQIFATSIGSYWNGSADRLGA